MFWLVFLGQDFAILTVILALCLYRPCCTHFVLPRPQAYNPQCSPCAQLLEVIDFQVLLVILCWDVNQLKEHGMLKIKRQVVNHFFSKLGGLEIFTCSCKINIFSDLILISVVPLLAEWCVSIHGLMSLFLLCPLMKSWKS